MLEQNNKSENEIEKEPTEELINRTLDTIQAKWDKKSEDAEEDGEGTVDFDVLLDEVKEALIFIFEKGKASKQKDVLKILDELEFKLLNELRFNAKPFVFQGKTGYTFTISTDELQEFRKRLEMKNNKIEIICEECNKKIKRKESLSIAIDGKIQPFYCCSFECLGLYINKLANIVDDGN